MGGDREREGKERDERDVVITEKTWLVLAGAPSTALFSLCAFNFKRANHLSVQIFTLPIFACSIIQTDTIFAEEQSF